IAEFVLPDGPEPFQGKWFDLAMLVITGGQERTAAEYHALLEPAGVRWRRLIPTFCELSLIEAEKP
ncbi:MAG TPA: methyltransferase, partial [Planctomycetaceae bacterium]|nr:methyltransferase [Planctomycetaceae bacterium]